jgi:hypothetical protein
MQHKYLKHLQGITGNSVSPENILQTIPMLSSHDGIYPLQIFLFVAG